MDGAYGKYKSFDEALENLFGGEDALLDFAILGTPIPNFEKLEDSGNGLPSLSSFLSNKANHKHCTIKPPFKKPSPLQLQEEVRQKLGLRPVARNELAVDSSSGGKLIEAHVTDEPRALGAQPSKRQRTARSNVQELQSPRATDRRYLRPMLGEEEGAVEDERIRVERGRLTNGRLSNQFGQSHSATLGLKRLSSIQPRATTPECSTPKQRMSPSKAPIAPCPICDHAIPRGQLEIHVSHCLASTGLEPTFEQTLETEKLPEHSSREPPLLNETVRQPQNHDFSPCPICEKLLPRDSLEAHLGVCMSETGIADAFG